MAEAQHQQRHHEASISSLLNSHDQNTSSRPLAPFPPILRNTTSPPLTAKLPPIHSSRPSVEWMNDHNNRGDTEVTPSTSPVPEPNDSTNSTINNDNDTTTTTNDKQYACGECDQTFGRPHNLKSHLATHSNERSYECDVCHHQFRRHHDLKRHQKLHTGEKPFVCAICMRSFARLDALNRHQRAEGGTSCSGVAPAQRRRLTNSGNNRSDSLNEDVQVSPTAEEETSNGGERRSSSFSVLEGNHNATHSDPYRAYTYPVPHRRNDRTMTYPPPMSMSGASQHVFTVSHDGSQSDRIRQLEKRNRELEVEVSTYRASIRSLKDMETLKRKVHDLEIENKVLRSLLVDNAEAANNPSKRKHRDSTSSQSSTPAVELPQPPLHSPRKETSVAAIAIDDTPIASPSMAPTAHLTSSFGNLPQTRSPEPM